MAPYTVRMVPANFVTILVAALLALLFLNLVFDIITISFAKLGISPWAAFAILAASALGSFINIPVWRKELGVTSGHFEHYHFHLFYVPPMVNEQVIAINVGGA